MGHRKSLVPETPSTPPNWEFWYDEVSGSNNNGWVVAYTCTRSRKHGEMMVYWHGPEEDTVDIVIAEYETPERKEEPTQPFDLSVPKIEAEKTAHEVAEAWIKAVDNESD